MELPSGLWALNIVPRIYDYLGISVLIHSNEHSPIHVHGRYQGFESKAEIYVNGTIVTAIDFVDIPGKRPLPPSKLRDFKKLVDHEADNIVKIWNDYFVIGKHFEPITITRRIR